MLSPISPKRVLFALPPSSPRNLPSFSVESTVSSSCSRSDPSFSRHNVALAHLDSLPSHDLVIWIDGSVPFSWRNWQLLSLSLSLFVLLRQLFPSTGPLCSSFPLKTAPFYNLFVVLDNTNKCAISLLLSDSRSVFSSFFPFILNSGRNCLLSSLLPLGFSGSSSTLLCRKTMRLMSWPTGSATLAPCNPF